MARRQILLKMIPLVQEEFVESEPLERLSTEEEIVDTSPERVFAAHSEHHEGASARIRHRTNGVGRGDCHQKTLFFGWS